MIMKEFVAGEGGEFAGYGEFARAWKSVEKK